ncbi:MAG: DUF748 domain-containing protein [Gemmatimonadales bacterium]
MAVTGSYTPEPVAASVDLRLDAVPLQPFQPYLNRFGRLVVKAGTLSLGGHATYAERGASAATTFQGDLSVDGFRAVDPGLQEDFTRWTRLDVRRIRYRSEPASLAIAEIVTRGAYLRAIVGPDRITNIQHVFTVEGDTITPWSGVGPIDSTQVDDTAGRKLPKAERRPPSPRRRCAGWWPPTSCPPR